MLKPPVADSRQQCGNGQNWGAKASFRNDPFPTHSIPRKPAPEKRIERCFLRADSCPLFAISAIGSSWLSVDNGAPSAAQGCPTLFGGRFIGLWSSFNQIAACQSPTLPLRSRAGHPHRGMCLRVVRRGPRACARGSDLEIGAVTLECQKKRFCPHLLAFRRFSPFDTSLCQPQYYPACGCPERDSGRCGHHETCAT